MEKTADNDYKYVGEIGYKEKLWKRYEVGWENFEAFLIEEKVSSPISLIWYKLPKEEMKDIKYVFDSSNEDMVELHAAGKQSGEIDVFLEHDCSAQSPKSVSFLSSSQHEDEKEYTNAERDGAERDGAERDDAGGYYPDGDDDCDDRPREDGEGEQSDDEHPVAEEEDVVKENKKANENDDGDDVVVDAGDGATDERFKTVFEEGAKTAADFMASQMRDNEENGEEAREAAESDDEDRLGDVIYPDTPLESDEEWDQWMCKRHVREKVKFHGSLDKEPYIWLFQIVGYSLRISYFVILLRHSMMLKWQGLKLLE